MKHSELKALVRLKKIAEDSTYAGAKAAVEFVEGPSYGLGQRDLFGSLNCAYTNPIHRMKFAICVECVHLDRPNMICRVGRLAR